MKKIKQKAFYIKAALLYIFLISVISIFSLFLWENSFYDLMMRIVPSTTTGSEEIALIVIDDKSVKAHRWPWKRSLYGDILTYFNNYTNVKAITFDTILNTLDSDNPQSDKNFFETVNKTPKFVGGFIATTANYNSTDNGEEYDKKFHAKYSVKIIDKRVKNKQSGYFKSIRPYPEPYFNALKTTGAVNVALDFDSIVRKSIDMVSYKGNLYPSLALRTYMSLNNADELTVTDDYIIVNKTGLKIPVLYTNGYIRHNIKFSRYIKGTEYSHKKYSAVDIIDSEKALREGKKPIIDPDEFKDKIIIIGGNAKAEAMGLADILETPVNHKQAGMDVQATSLDNLLNNNFVIKTSFGQNILSIVVLSILSFLIITNFSFIVSLLAIIAIAVIYLILCFICFNYNIAPLIFTPVAAQLGTMIFGYSYRFILEGRNKEKIKQAMGKYLSQDIMQNVVQNIDDIRLGGKKANVTVLFADIRGFTSMSEKMTAEEVSVILNEYFSEIEPIITKYNGVINKFIGDAVMAIFGEPIQDLNHPANAVKCANEMLKKVEWLQGKWINEGKPKIEIGIGINTGEAFVGNIGSEKRLEYTVIGDMVNLASRIESYNKVYKTNFLISSSTYSYVSSLTDVIKISEVTIRGKSKKMDIYEVLRITNNSEVR